MTDFSPLDGQAMTQLALWCSVIADMTWACRDTLCSHLDVLGEAAKGESCEQYGMAVWKARNAI